MTYLIVAPRFTKKISTLGILFFVLLGAGNVADAEVTAPSSSVDKVSTPATSKTTAKDESTKDANVTQSKSSIHRKVTAHPAKKPSKTLQKKDERNSEKTAKTDVTELVQEARKAWWEGRVPEAISAYQRLIQAYPEANYYGELGNIYYQLGNGKEAAQYYYRAAQKLISQGKVLQAGALLPTIQTLDPILAKKLLASQDHSKKEKH